MHRREDASSFQVIRNLVDVPLMAPICASRNSLKPSAPEGRVDSLRS